MNIFNKLAKELYFMTDTVVGWGIFTRPTYKHIVVESLQYCQAHKGLEIYAWVLMSNHLHTIVSTKDEIKITRRRHTGKPSGMDAGQICI